jgi:hypothetical protein
MNILVPWNGHRLGLSVSWMAWKKENGEEAVSMLSSVQEKHKIFIIKSWNMKILKWQSQVYFNGNDFLIQTYNFIQLEDLET